MKVVILLVLGIGSTFGLPAKLDHLLASPGYNFIPPAQPSGLYEPPTQPSGLYETPSQPSGLYELPQTTPTTTTTTPPPPPPPPSYLPPEETNIIPEVIVPEVPLPKSAMMLMPYEFAYGVDDSESANQFSHSETSDGQHVTGKYSVLLPDGRLQVVKFASDPVGGYRADVSYILP